MTQDEIERLRSWHRHDQTKTLKWPNGKIERWAYCSCGLPWPCLTLQALDELEAATRVIAAVRARRAASREHDRVRSDSADIQEWRYVRDKYMDALQEETRALMDWEEMNYANQSNAT